MLPLEACILKAYSNELPILMALTTEDFLRLFKLFTFLSINNRAYKYGDLLHEYYS